MIKTILSIFAFGFSEGHSDG